MTRVKLTFNIIFDTDANDLDNMGEELALFLQETFHNGEDTFWGGVCGIRNNQLIFFFNSLRNIYIV